MASVILTFWYHYFKCVMTEDPANIERHRRHLGTHKSLDEVVNGVMKQWGTSVRVNAGSLWEMSFVVRLRLGCFLCAEIKSGSVADQPRLLQSYSIGLRHFSLQKKWKINELLPEINMSGLFLVARTCEKRK